MSFKRAFQWYHSHADPIWPDGTFKMKFFLMFTVYGSRTLMLIVDLVKKNYSFKMRFYKAFLSYTPLWIFFLSGKFRIVQVQFYCSFFDLFADPLFQCCGSRMFIPDPGYDFFHPGSWIRILTFYPSRIQWSKRHQIRDPDPQHSCIYCIAHCPNKC